jgi:hypothetical protein
MSRTFMTASSLARSRRPGHGVESDVMNERR